MFVRLTCGLPVCIVMTGTAMAQNTIWRTYEATDPALSTPRVAFGGDTGIPFTKPMPISALPDDATPKTDNSTPPTPPRARPVVVATSDQPAPPAPPPKPVPKTMPDFTPTAADLGSEPPSIFASCCDPCNVCGPPGCAWVNVEWLYWATTGQHIPALVTASSLGMQARF